MARGRGGFIEPPQKKSLAETLANPREMGRLGKVRSRAGPEGRSRCNDASLKRHMHAALQKVKGNRPADGHRQAGLAWPEIALEFLAPSDKPL